MTFDQAFKLFYSRIVSFCKQYTKKDPSSAEDIATDAFVTLFEKWDTLKSHEEPVILVWLLHAAKLKGLEFLRSRPPETISYEDDYAQNMIAKQMLESDSIPDAIEEAMKFEEYKDALRAYLKKPEERKLFIYVVERNLKFQEIALKMNLSEAAVKMRWYRLKRKLYPIAIKITERKL